MSIRKSLLLSSAILLAPETVRAQVAAAAILDMNVSEEATQFEAAGRVIGLELGGGYLTSDDRSSDTSAGYISMGSGERIRDYEGGGGFRWTQYDTEYGDGGGLGFHSYLYYYLPAVPRLSLGGFIYYMPNVITSQDVESGFEVAARARYEVMDNIEAYVGYRHVEMDFDDHDEFTTLDSGPLAGLRLIF